MPVRPLIDQAVELVSPLLEQMPQAVSIHCPNVAHRPAWTRRVEQVLWNLLNNAHEYSHAGSAVTIEARINTDQVEVRVSASGNRIPEADLPHLFQPSESPTSS